MKKGKHPDGRPTLYKGAETCAAVLDFAAGMTAENFPERCSKASLAVHLLVDEETILNWEKEHAEFFGAIKTWKAKRDATAFKFRLWGDGRWIFCMKNWTGMNDRQQVEHSGNINSKLTIEVVRTK